MKAKTSRSRGEPERASMESITMIQATASGEWLDAEQLRTLAASAAVADAGVEVDLTGVDHLDASALQTLLSLAAERKQQGRELRLANASEALRQWFEYAGATRHFSFA